VEVNQRDLVDKVLARYPEEFTGTFGTTSGQEERLIAMKCSENCCRMRMMLAPETSILYLRVHTDMRVMGRHQILIRLRYVIRQITGYGALTFSSNKVFKWLVRNDGAQFQDTDWKRLTKIGL
jgi:hypothetical protein